MTEPKPRNFWTPSGDKEEWYSKKDFHQLQAQVTEAQGELKSLHDKLERASRRSSYPWSSGPDYNWSDERSEGAIELALDLLGRRK